MTPSNTTLRATLAALCLVPLVALAKPAKPAKGAKPAPAAAEKKAEEKKPDEKKADEKKADAAKPEEKKPDEAKPEEKKADEKKADEKKADEKKADEKKADEKKADEKKPEEKKAEAAKPEEKKPEAGKPAETAPVAVAAPAEPAERSVEKKSGEYTFRLVMKPGNLKPGRVADIAVEVQRILDIPDPTTGDRMPVASMRPVASVKLPIDPKKKDAPGSARYLMAPLTAPGTYAFHFTPTVDGVVDVTIEGDDSKNESDEPKAYEASFKLGVGTAAAQTEMSQGAAAGRRGARRPVGAGTTEKAQEEKIQRLMEEIGSRYLDLEALLGRPPAKGPHAEAAAEARALAALFGQVKGLVPPAYIVGAGDFDKLADAVPARLEAVAVAAEGKDRNAPKAALAEVEKFSCLQCHAKFRYGVTTDLTTWPKFEQKGWK